MKPNVRLLAPVLALALFASACGDGGPLPGGGGGEDLTEVADRIRGQDADDVEPPKKLDEKVLPPTGVIFQSNSPTWQRLVDGPEGRGVLVIFISPGSLMDGRGIARGDLLTEVNGTRVYNPETAIAQLHAPRSEKLALKFKRRGSGADREVEVRPQLPRQGPRAFLDGLIKGNPNDPVLRFARAASGGTATQNLNDLNVAIKEEPAFAEALSSRAVVLFRQRAAAKDKKGQDAKAGEALANWKNALDINPRHAETFARRGLAQIRMGKVDAGKADVQKALRIDETLPSANWALAEAEIARKKPAEAAGPARAAIELNPFGDLRYYRTLAEVFKGLKRKEDCQQSFNAPVDWLNGTKVKAYRDTARQLADEAKKSC